MAVRYYRLKEDRQDVCSMVLIVNTDLSPKKRIESYAGDEIFSLNKTKRFYHVYDVFEDDYLVGSLESRVSWVLLKKKRKLPYKIKLNKKGSLEVKVTRKNKKVFIEEINKKEADELRTAYFNYKAHQYDLSV